MTAEYMLVAINKKPQTDNDQASIEIKRTIATQYALGSSYQVPFQQRKMNNFNQSNEQLKDLVSSTAKPYSCPFALLLKGNYIAL